MREELGLWTQHNASTSAVLLGRGTEEKCMFGNRSSEAGFHKTI